MSMPTGQTCTQIVQSMQSPSCSGGNFGSGSDSLPASKVMVPRACSRASAALGWRLARNT